MDAPAAGLEMALEAVGMQLFRERCSGKGPVSLGERRSCWSGVSRGTIRMKRPIPVSGWERALFRVQFQGPGFTRNKKGPKPARGRPDSPERPFRRFR